jgi:hypothetical protein
VAAAAALLECDDEPEKGVMAHQSPGGQAPRWAVQPFFGTRLPKVFTWSNRDELSSSGAEKNPIEVSGGEHLGNVSFLESSSKTTLLEAFLGSATLFHFF